MNMLRFPVSIYPILLVAGTLLVAAPAVSEAFDLNECGVPCTTQHKACLERVKDSPNDIERELCETERKDCLAACDAAFAEAQREEQERQRLEREERARLGIKEHRGTAEEREEEYERQQEREAQEKQERQEKAAREEQERQEKAAQKKLEEETLNGIPIFQFK